MPFADVWGLVGNTNDSDLAEIDSFFDEAVADLEKWIAEGQSILHRLQHRQPKG